MALAITVVGWHSYERDQGPITYFTEAALLWFYWQGYGRHRDPEHFMESALQWLTGTVMGEIRPHNIFHDATITIVGWHDYVGGLGP